ncbi:MAG: response regulator, partial [Paracoccaceae bacterium]|nr:response regulator [Paracoccaceae bacterium]
TLALGMPPSPASAGMADAVPAPATGWLAGKSVLVVDDVATNRMVAAAYLQSLGVRVSEAASGQAALSALKQALPDLVLLDMNMPGLDGLETLRRIRDLTGPTTRLPVIAMTADAMEEQRQHYLASGVDGYLAKPILPERLAEELNRQLCPGNQGPTSANSGR